MDKEELMEQEEVTALPYAQVVVQQVPVEAPQVNKMEKEQFREQFRDLEKQMLTLIEEAFKNSDIDKRWLSYR
jgi:hypothetical protein